MIARKLPSLHALRAFEAAARHCSFTLAAQELHVTQGAVSHQIKALEEELGRPLFTRLPNQLKLTRQGKAYLVSLGEAFDRIEQATAALAKEDDPRTHLAISASPNFSAKWLAPRLGDFARQHPSLALRLEQSERHVDFLRDGIDAAIRYGLGPWPGLACLRLGEEFLVPVCAPIYADLRTAHALADHTLLHVDNRQAWSDWFAEQGLPASDMPRRPGIVFNHDSAAIDAAIAGHGVALARWSLVVLALRNGILAAPLPRGAVLRQAYWLVHSPIPGNNANIAAFTDWLQQSFRTDRALRDAITHA